MPTHFSLQHRSAGVLMHITSLPGAYGCGDIGRGARAFADFLQQAGQRWWQVLPIGPIGPGDSPYSSPSAFAGNPLLIDLEQLHEQGLLTGDELSPPRRVSDAKVRFPACIRYRTSRLRAAFKRFRSLKHLPAGYEKFCQEQRGWLDDWCLFHALKKAHGGAAWFHWDPGPGPAPGPGIRRRQPAALRSAQASLHDQIEYERFVQFTFSQQWLAFKRYCNHRGVGLIGDVPIFVDHDSCDVWAHRELFQLDVNGRPQAVSGVPPDMFSKTGQKWGHPLYRWARHRATGFAWWIERFRAAMQLFDAIRIDHFLGFHRFWSIPPQAPTAKHGKWVHSPGHELFEQAHKSLGPLNILAEDLGVVTPQAIAMRDRFGFLGMRLLQNAFTDTGRLDLPHNYPRNCVAYTGTHDNDTTVGWFHAIQRSHRRDQRSVLQRILRYTGTDGRQIHWDLIRLLYLSQADGVMVPMQDVLGLGSRHRMNIPGVPRGQWRWRMEEGACTDALADRLRQLAQAYERNGPFGSD